MEKMMYGKCVQLCTTDEEKLREFLEKNAGEDMYVWEIKHKEDCIEIEIDLEGGANLYLPCKAIIKNSRCD